MTTATIPDHLLGLIHATQDNPMDATAVVDPGRRSRRQRRRERTPAAAHRAGTSGQDVAVNGPFTATLKTILKRMEYKKRKVVVVIATEVKIEDTQRSGGTWSEYTTVHLHSGPCTHRIYGPSFGDHNVPVVKTGKGDVVAQTGYFCGKPVTMTIYVHPDDYPTLMDWQG